MLYHVSERKNMHVAHMAEMCLFTTAFADHAEGTLPVRLIVSYSKDHSFTNPEQKIGPEPLEVDLDPDTYSLDGISITMHSSACVGYDMGDECNKWFSDRFGYEVKLLNIGKNKRKVLGNLPPNVAGLQRDEVIRSKSNGTRSWHESFTASASWLIRSVTSYHDDYDGVDEGIAFSDVAPYMVVSSKSCEDATRRLASGEVMDITKFRPNLVIAGSTDAYEEDFWAELQIGDNGIKMILTQSCARCTSINVDYVTGKAGVGEAGMILKKLQSDRRVDLGARWSPVFGRFGFLARVTQGSELPEIKVGDQVKIARRNTDRTRIRKSPDLYTQFSGHFM